MRPPIFLSDVKARYNKLVGLVETTLTADSWQLTARVGQDGILDGTVTADGRREPEGVRVSRFDVAGVVL
jgi:hypothetical protein